MKAPSESPRQTIQARVGNRRPVIVAGRLTWRDANGTLRFASVVTRDVSESDAFLECYAPTSIPKYRLVHFQVERTARGRHDLPDILKSGKLLSAIYRVAPCEAATGAPRGYAIRLITAPTARRAARAPLAVAN
jgi:hypothetical protein